MSRPDRLRRANPRHARPTWHYGHQQPAPVRLDHRTQHLVMRGQRHPHLIGVGLPPTGRPSTSVNRNVTTPEGAAAADTLAE